MCRTGDVDRGAVATAQGLQLGGYDFSVIGVDSGLADACRAAHQWALGLLQGAQTNLDELGTALAQTADTYQATDDAGAGSFGDLHGELGATDDNCDCRSWWRAGDSGTAR